MTRITAADDGLVEALRARRDKGKEPIQREAMQDRRLTFKARGLLAYLLSKPDRWRTSAVALAADSDRDGRDAVSTALVELETAGYLLRNRRHGDDGRWTWLWIYSDDPSEVAEVARDLGFNPDPAARRGRVRAPAPTKHRASSQVGPINGFSVDGLSVDGKPVDIERREKERTPQPPAAAGGAVADRCEHGRRQCRPCGTSPRARAAEAARLSESVELARAESCPWCKRDRTSPSQPWLVVDPRAPATFLTPYRRCDHETSNERVLAELD